MEHKNKEKLDWIIASNIHKGINLQTVYGTYLEIRELLQKKINECRKKDVVHYKDAFFEFQDQKIQATVIFEGSFTSNETAAGASFSFLFLPGIQIHLWR